MRMSFSPEIAFRIRSLLKSFPEDFEEKKMFGGLSFLYQGKMTVGIIKEELAVRVLSDKMEQALKNPYVRPMNFTKRPLKEFVFVSESGFHTEEQLSKWVELGVEHAKSRQ